MTFFSEKGFPCYAHSWRGHGASWKSGYFQTVWMTGKASIAEDLGYAFSWVEGFQAAKRDGPVSRDDIVLIGHPTREGLSQYFLSRGLGTVGGLVIMAAFPPFGG
jgi:pimeloyl-ACP methyl ester carboxylesterase